MNIVQFADFFVLILPARRLHLADVSFAEEEHTHSRLTDTSAHCKRKLVFKQCLVEGEARSVLTARNSKLMPQCLGIDTDTHRGKLKRDIEHGVVNDDIAV